MINLEKAKQWLPYAGIPVVSIAFAVLSWNWLPPVEILLFEVLLVFGYGLAVHDLRTKTVPNLVLLIMTALWTLIEIPVIVSNFERGAGMMISAGMGALIGGGVFFVVYILSKHGLGAGDVKFMAVAGLYLGLNLIMSAMLMGAILSAVTGLGLVCFKKLKKTDEIPLVPFLYAGIVITLFLL